MDLKALDKALLEIVKNRAELGKIDYNNPKYDELEEQLHDLEDDFHDEYGEYLEDIVLNKNCIHSLCKYFVILHDVSCHFLFNSIQSCCL